MRRTFREHRIPLQDRRRSRGTFFRQTCNISVLLSNSVQLRHRNEYFIHHNVSKTATSFHGKPPDRPGSGRISPFQADLMSMSWEIWLLSSIMALLRPWLPKLQCSRENMREKRYCARWKDSTSRISIINTAALWRPSDGIVRAPVPWAEWRVRRSWLVRHRAPDERGRECRTGSSTSKAQPGAAVIGCDR